jgi:hypothetical protein
MYNSGRLRTIFYLLVHEERPREGREIVNFAVSAGLRRAGRTGVEQILKKIKKRPVHHILIEIFAFLKNFGSWILDPGSPAYIPENLGDNLFG